MVAVSAAMAWLPVAVAVGQTRMFPADEWETRRPEDQQVYWYMSGNGGQFNMVLPAEGIVFTRVNNYANTPRVLIEDFEPLIFDLVIP